MSLPVAVVIRPRALDGAVNGVLAPGLLEVVGDKGLLLAPAARAWRPLVALAALSGFQLTYTYGGTYRSYGEQVSLFGQRYTRTPLPFRPTKVWAGKTYWQKPDTAMAAVPGESNHGWGIAVDTAIGPNPAHASEIAPRGAWLLANAPRFGWSWETQSELWHIRLVTGDKPTPAVLAYEASLGGHPAPAPAPVPSNPGVEDMASFHATVIGRNAEYVGQGVLMPDGSVDVTFCMWTGDGNDPAVQAFVGDHDHNAVKIVVSPDTIKRDWVLLGPVPPQGADAVYAWGRGDYFRVIP